MILPTKHIPTPNSLLAVGALVLEELRRPQTLTALWDRLREVPEVATFSRLVLAVDMLYLLDAIVYDDGLLRRKGP
jgi:hypothetical protein